MATLYDFAPDVEQQWRWVTPGSVFAILGWIAASLGFSFCVNNFGPYNANYCSIGPVIVLLTWMYLGCLFSPLAAKSTPGSSPRRRAVRGWVRRSCPAETGLWRIHKTTVTWQDGQQVGDA
jgi:hypothetical protein